MYSLQIKNSKKQFFFKNLLNFIIIICNYKYKKLKSINRLILIIKTEWIKLNGYSDGE